MAGANIPTSINWQICFYCNFSWLGYG